jgi:hypothetical protein
MPAEFHKTLSFSSIRKKSHYQRINLSQVAKPHQQNFFITTASPAAIFNFALINVCSAAKKKNKKTKLHIQYETAIIPSLCLNL